MMVWFGFLAALSIGMQRWCDRRRIAEFAFDGSLLRFKTRSRKSGNGAGGAGPWGIGWIFETAPKPICGTP
jgi:hypothetical protein